MPANGEAEQFRLPTDIPALFLDKSEAERYAENNNGLHGTLWEVVETEVY